MVMNKILSPSKINKNTSTHIIHNFEVNYQNRPNNLNNNLYMNMLVDYKKIQVCDTIVC
jgi:hypothetical protein